MIKQAIGVFDSGVGGLLALQDLIRHYPNESFIYLADTKNCPYGVKSQNELKEIVTKNILFLENLGVKAIVIACNTASVVKLDITPSVPIIRIVEPTIAIAKKTGKKIAVLATNFTISQRTYQNLLGANSVGVACSAFVPLVEAGQYDTAESFNVVYDLVSPLKGKVDTVILGCTHFGLLENDIKKVLGEVAIVDSALSITPVLPSFVSLETDNINRKVTLYTTGDVSQLHIPWFSEKIDEKKSIVIK